MCNLPKGGGGEEKERGLFAAVHTVERILSYVLTGSLLRGTSPINLVLPYHKYAEAHESLLGMILSSCGRLFG